MLCNCCNAVQGNDEKTIGAVVIPTKKGTKMAACNSGFTRNEGCTSLCKKTGGCAIQISIDFSQGNLKICDNRFYLCRE